MRVCKQLEKERFAVEIRLGKERDLGEFAFRECSDKKRGFKTWEDHWG